MNITFYRGFYCNLGNEMRNDVPLLSIFPSAVDSKGADSKSTWVTGEVPQRVEQLYRQRRIAQMLDRVKQMLGGRH